MGLFKPQVKTLIERKDFDGLNQLLTDNPDLANQGITIPYDLWCRTKAHPLHRICDGVISGKITDDKAVNFAEIFLSHGADIDGDKARDGGTPLLAAASLHAEQVGIFYINNGADVHYTYKGDGATALHWASFCGRDKLVDRLIKADAVIDAKDTEHKSTPLGWALHALMKNDKMNAHNQFSCIKMLLRAGADKEKLSKEHKEYLEKLANEQIFVNRY
ncbi:MAG TPA: ankyrin repeat domain-containing protein [Sphingobacteriaceae bacterium]